MIKSLLLIFIFSINISYSLQKKSFDAIKVGMTSAQVEKLVGLPIQIFRGFTEIENYEIKVVGQLNYVCWRYSSSKRTVFAEFNDSELSTKKDTVFIYNGVESTKYSKRDAQKIKDTIYFYSDNSNYKRVLTRSEYYDSIKLSKSSSVYCVPVLSKEIKIIDRINIDNDLMIQKEPVHNKYFLISNICVLFEPSSNRVIQVEYLPTVLELKKSKIKYR
jgi:hypothetical protein